MIDLLKRATTSAFFAKKCALDPPGAERLLRDHLDIVPGNDPADTRRLQLRRVRIDRDNGIDLLVLERVILHRERQLQKLNFREIDAGVLDKELSADSILAVELGDRDFLALKGLSSF